MTISIPPAVALSAPVLSPARKAYVKPAIVHELNLETRAGSCKEDRLPLLLLLPFKKCDD